MDASFAIFTYRGDADLIQHQVGSCLLLQPKKVYVLDEKGKELPPDLVKWLVSLPRVEYRVTEFDRRGNLNGVECIKGQLMAYKTIQMESMCRRVIKIDSDTLVQEPLIQLSDHHQDVVGNTSQADRKTWRFYGCCYGILQSKLDYLWVEACKWLDQPHLLVNLGVSPHLGEDEAFQAIIRHTPDLTHHFLDLTQKETWQSLHAWNYRKDTQLNPGANAISFGNINFEPHTKELTPWDKKALMAFNMKNVLSLLQKNDDIRRKNGLPYTKVGPSYDQVRDYRLGVLMAQEAEKVEHVES